MFMKEMLFRKFLKIMFVIVKSSQTLKENQSAFEDGFSVNITHNVAPHYLGRKKR